MEVIFLEKTSILQMYSLVQTYAEYKTSACQKLT